MRAVLVAGSFAALASGCTGAPSSAGDPIDPAAGSFLETEDPRALTWVTPLPVTVVDADEPVDLVVATQHPDARVVHFAVDGQEVGACDTTDPEQDCHDDDTWTWTTTFDAAGSHTVTASFVDASGTAVTATQSIDVVADAQDDAIAPSDSEDDPDPLSDDELVADGTSEIVEAITGPRGYLDPSTPFHRACGGVEWQTQGGRVLLRNGRIDGSSSQVARCWQQFGDTFRAYADRSYVSRAALVAGAIAAGNCGLGTDGWRHRIVRASACAAIANAGGDHVTPQECGRRMDASADFAIEVETRYLTRRGAHRRHHDDPPRVAALLATGAVRCSLRDPWHLRAPHGYIDRFVGAYNAYRTAEHMGLLEPPPPAPPADPAHAIAVAYGASPHAIGGSFAGLNGNNLSGGHPWAWNASRLDGALASFGPQLLRYPAGTIANYWDWGRAWYQPHPANQPWPNEPSSPIDDSLHAFAAAVHASGAEPVFDLNLLTHEGRIANDGDNDAMVAAAIRALDNARAEGLDVHLLELGNEFYLSGPPGDDGRSDYVRRFATALDYAQQASAWTRALHRAFPNARVAAVGCVGGCRDAGWNQTVLDRLGDEDALTIHWYPQMQRIPFLTPRDALEVPYRHWSRNVRDAVAAIAARGKEVWVTEYNITSGPGVLHVSGRWVHGLLVATMTTLLASEPGVTHAALHNVIGGDATGALFASSEGFGAGNAPTTTLAPTAAGAALSLIARAAHGADSARGLAFAPTPTLRDGSPAVFGVAFAGGRGPQLVLVNLGDGPVTLDASGVAPGADRFEQIWADSLETEVTGPSRVHVATGAAGGQLVLRAGSITRVHP